MKTRRLVFGVALLAASLLGAEERRPLALADVPAAVRAAIQRAAGDRFVADIDREWWHGQPVYEVEIAQVGRNARIYVAENGDILRDDPRPSRVADWFRTTEFEDIPRAVQEAIEREARGHRLRDIDRRRDNGLTAYLVEFGDDQGNTFRLSIAEDGSVRRESHRIPLNWKSRCSPNSPFSHKAAIPTRPTNSPAC